MWLTCHLTHWPNMKWTSLHVASLFAQNPIWTSLGQSRTFTFLFEKSCWRVSIPRNKTWNWDTPFKMHNFSKPWTNLDCAEWAALDALARERDIVIKPSNKGCNVVVMDNAQYVEMCMNKLSNPEWYRPIQRSLLDKFTKDFYSMVDTAFHHNVITKQMWEFIRTSYPKEATF